MGFELSIQPQSVHASCYARYYADFLNEEPTQVIKVNEDYPFRTVTVASYKKRTKQAKFYIIVKANDETVTNMNKNSKTGGWTETTILDTFKEWIWAFNDMSYSGSDA